MELSGAETLLTQTVFRALRSLACDMTFNQLPDDPSSQTNKCLLNCERVIIARDWLCPRVSMPSPVLTRSRLMTRVIIRFKGNICGLAPFELNYSWFLSATCWWMNAFVFCRMLDFFKI